MGPEIAGYKTVDYAKLGLGALAAADGD
jgi:hypothetical protein